VAEKAGVAGCNNGGGSAGCSAKAERRKYQLAAMFRLYYLWRILYEVYNHRRKLK
jgi:hypothetical protein